MSLVDALSGRMMVAGDAMTLEDSANIEVHSLSDPGMVREDNQDAIQLCAADPALTAQKGYLYALADGMGGYEHGGIASTLALKTLFDSFYGNSSNHTAGKLRAGVRDANLSVFQSAQRMKVRMGTTLTALHIQHNQLTIAHIGDSRAYLVRGTKSTCLTQDHTTVGDMVRARVLSPDKVRTHSQRSMLNRTLGMEMFIQPDISTVKIFDGDWLVLCCDGVWSAIEDNEFADLATQATNANSLTRRLVDLAMERESDDNVSVVALRIHAVGQRSGATAKKSVLGRLPFFRNRLADDGT